MDYLVYVSHDAENLQFYLWLQDYTKRFYAAPRSEQVLSPPWFDAEAAAQPSSYNPTNGDKPLRTADKSRVDLAEYEMKFEIAAAVGEHPPLPPVLSAQGYEKYEGGFDNKSVLSGIHSMRTIADSVDDANTQMGLRWQSCESSPRPLPTFISPFSHPPPCNQYLKFPTPAIKSHNPTLPLRNQSRHITLPRPHLPPRTQPLPPRSVLCPPCAPTYHPSHRLNSGQGHGRSRPPRPIAPQLHPLVHLQRQQGPSALRPQLWHHPHPGRTHPRHLTSLILRFTVVASVLFPAVFCGHRYQRCCMQRIVCDYTQVSF